MGLVDEQKICPTCILYGTDFPVDVTCVDCSWKPSDISYQDGKWHLTSCDCSDVRQTRPLHAQSFFQEEFCGMDRIKGAERHSITFCLTADHALCILQKISGKKASIPKVFLRHAFWNIQINDPYVVVQDKIKRLSTLLHSRYEDWRQLPHQKHLTPRDFGKHMKRNLQKIFVDIRDLENTNAIVSSHREKFPHIDDQELAKRERFLADTKKQLEKYLDERKELQDQKNETDIRISDSSKYSEIELVQRQSSYEEEEEEILGDIKDHLDRLQIGAIVIQQEFEQNDIALDQFEEEVDSATSSMKLSLSKLERQLSRPGRWQIYCIVFLVAVALTLLLVIVLV